MTLRPQPLPPVPEATVVAVQAAFPKGNLYVDLRAEFGTLYDDQLFADLYPPLRASRGSRAVALSIDRGDAVYRRAHRLPSGRCRPALHGLAICFAQCIAVCRSVKRP
jgi:hypothetical protein